MRALVGRALAALGIRRFVLAVHDASLPGDPSDDTGRGAPLSRGGLGLIEFAAGLGFDGLQLGPQGQTSELDPSPYDGTIFSRNTLSIALQPLVEQGLIADRTLAEAVAARPAGSALRSAHRYVHALQRRVLAEAWQKGARALAEPLAAFMSANADWLEREGLYWALAAENNEPDWLRWPERDRTYPDADRRTALKERHAALLSRLAFEQLLAHRQHEQVHARAGALGLRLSGDLQIGVSHQDVWSYGELFHSGLRLGAPPSRTNPEGQPWNYGVLDPAKLGTSASPGPALAYLRRRVGKLLAELDGLRIDHPHGLIDPWVYRAAQVDQLAAVQGGARLHSSPDRLALAGLAIARLDQLNLSLPRHADEWVRELSPAQVDSYAVLFDEVVAAARAQGSDTQDLIVEVLSTLPYPIARVLARHGLGRFRVTQKAGLDDPRDVYRSENAAPADWIMAGSHDTEPIWSVAERWVQNGTAEAHARHLAGRLIPNESERSSSAAWLATDPARLASARLAELFLGPARNVMVFFTDLLGMKETYNRPGTVSDDNWSLRVPPDYQARYAEDAAAGRAFNVPAALTLAIRARGAEFARVHAGLLLELEQEQERHRS